MKKDFDLKKDIKDWWGTRIDREKKFFLDLNLSFFFSGLMLIMAMVLLDKIGLWNIYFAPSVLLRDLIISGPEFIRSELREVNEMAIILFVVLFEFIFWAFVWFVALRSFRFIHKSLFKKISSEKL